MKGCYGWISLTKALALDCEMVGVGYEGKRNALARVSLVCSTSQTSVSLEGFPSMWEYLDVGIYACIVYVIFYLKNDLQQ